MLFPMWQHNFIFPSIVCEDSISPHAHQHDLFYMCFLSFFKILPARGEGMSYWGFDLEFLMTRALQ